MLYDFRCKSNLNNNDFIKNLNNNNNDLIKNLNDDDNNNNNNNKLMKNLRTISRSNRKLCSMTSAPNRFNPLSANVQNIVTSE